MELNKKEWVIGLYDYSSIANPSNLFETFSETVSDLLSVLGIELTHFAAEGGSFSGRAQGVSGKAYQKLRNDRFQEVSVLSMMCVPLKSDAPSYHRCASASLSILPHGDNMLVFALNDGIAQFAGSKFERVLRALVNLHSWVTGLGFVDLVEKQPEFHVMGLDSGILSADELQLLTKWYISSPADKVNRVRSVYPYNLLNSEQLSQKVEVDTTLEAFIAAGFGELEEIGGLSLWKVPPTQVETVRERLRGSQAFISL